MMISATPSPKFAALPACLHDMNLGSSATGLRLGNHAELHSHLNALQALLLSQCQILSAFPRRICPGRSCQDGFLGLGLSRAQGICRCLLGCCCCLGELGMLTLLLFKACRQPVPVSMQVDDFLPRFLQTLNLPTQ